jgi:hypothetical protein
MENVDDIGISKSLQEILNVELYAIIDTNKFIKKTFENQKFVKIKKNKKIMVFS